MITIKQSGRLYVVRGIRQGWDEEQKASPVPPEVLHSADGKFRERHVSKYVRGNFIKRVYTCGRSDGHGSNIMYIHRVKNEQYCPLEFELNSLAGSIQLTSGLSRFSL